MIHIATGIFIPPAKRLVYVRTSYILAKEGTPVVSIPRWEYQLPDHTPQGYAIAKIQGFDFLFSSSVHGRCENLHDQISAHS